MWLLFRAQLCHVHSLSCTIFVFLQQTFALFFQLPSVWPFTSPRSPRSVNYLSMFSKCLTLWDNQSVLVLCWSFSCSKVDEVPHSCHPGPFNLPHPYLDAGPADRLLVQFTLCPVLPSPPPPSPGPQNLWMALWESNDSEHPPLENKCTPVKSGT